MTNIQNYINVDGLVQQAINDRCFLKEARDMAQTVLEDVISQSFTNHQLSQLDEEFDGFTSVQYDTLLLKLDESSFSREANLLSELINELI